MLDAFLVHHFDDAVAARELSGTLAGRGFEVGHPLELWPQMRLLTRIDDGLIDHRFAVVIVSREFLQLGFQAKELDGLTRRRRVLCLLHGVGERDVASESPRLAVSAIPGGMAGRLVRLLGKDEK
jgi:hypothetical protein